MKSKLSLHIMNWDPVDVTNEWLEHVRPPLFKVMDGGLSDNKIEDARRFLAPGGLVVGRVFLDDQKMPSDDNLTTYNPRAAAQQVFEWMRADIDKMGSRVDVWEGINEFAVDEDKKPLDDKHWTKARHFSNFTVELAEMVRHAGRDYAAYSFSTGNPNHLEIWEALEPGLLASKYLALHEYIHPGEDYNSPGYSMCLRHREVYETLSPAARAHVKMLITECGADLGGVPGREGGGFKRRVTDDAYWTWLREYDKILLQDPYVLGATIYTYGESRGWSTYNIHGPIAKMLMNRIATLEDTPTPTTPPVVDKKPTKPPKPTQGLLLLAQVREHVKEAIGHLEANQGDAAHKILSKTVIPWFYASAPQHSDSLANAEAHTAARWHCEEATRRIEAGKLGEARDILRDNVLVWLDSPGPGELGILSVQATTKAKSPKKKTAAKKSSSKKTKAKRTSAGAAKKGKGAVKKTKAGPKPKRK